MGKINHPVHDSIECLAKADHKSLTLTNIVLLLDPNKACLGETDEIAGHTTVDEEVLGREPAAVAGTLPWWSDEGKKRL